MIMELQCTVGNLTAREHGFLASVLTVFCDPKYEHLRREVMAGEASLRAKREGEFVTPEVAAMAALEGAKNERVEYVVTVRNKWPLRFWDDLPGKRCYEVVPMRKASRFNTSREAHDKALEFSVRAYQVQEVRP